MKSKVKTEISCENICVVICIEWPDLINVYSVIKNFFQKTLAIFYKMVLFLISHIKIKIFTR